MFYYDSCSNHVVDGESTGPINCDADAATMKQYLETLSTIGEVNVKRSPVSIVGGYVWTVSFIDDMNGTHRGDMPEFQISSNLAGGSGTAPSIQVKETMKGTAKEVQRISISAGGEGVDPSSSFKLEFQGQTTNDILALPIDGSTCLGATTAKQLITSSTEDTSTEGGDETVSPLTFFELHYEGFKTTRVAANNGTCQESGSTIADALLQLPVLQNVSVKGQSSGLDDEGCVWEISLLSATGNPSLIQGNCL